MNSSYLAYGLKHILYFLYAHSKVESLSRVLTSKSPRCGHQGDPNHAKGLTKLTSKSSIYAMFLYHMLKLSFKTHKTYLYPKKLCHNRRCSNYGDVGKHFALSGGRWGLKNDHVKSTVVLLRWMRVLPYSFSRVLHSALCFTLWD